MKSDMNSFSYLISNMIEVSPLKTFNISLFSILLIYKLNIFNITKYIEINKDNVQIINGIIDIAFLIEGAIFLSIIILFIIRIINKFLNLFLPKNLNGMNNSEIIHIYKKSKKRNVIYVLIIINLIIFIILR